MRKSLQKEKITEAAPPLPESEFSFGLARVAVSQICQSMGFTGAQRPAIEALTDVATRYLREIAKVSTASANSYGRTQSNIFDIIYALEDMASVPGFPGSSIIIPRSLFTSAVIKDLMKFVKYTDEIPFAQPLPPRRNFFNKGSISKCRDSNGWYNVAGTKHVPKWLPAVPLVEGSEKREEREREVMWECLGSREGRAQENWECDERKTAERELNNEMEKSEKRGKVRFKMGEELGGGRRMVGKLRGVGIGKRVWCE